MRYVTHVKKSNRHRFSFGKLKALIANLARAIAEGHRSAALLDELGSAKGNSRIPAKNSSRLIAGGLMLGFERLRNSFRNGIRPLHDHALVARRVLL
jgi:hypothetical protein